LGKAKAEGTVVFYTSAGLTEMKPLVDGFSKKFPFIRVELYRGISEKLLTRSSPNSELKHTAPMSC
jgi:hypothetical protein